MLWIVSSVPEIMSVAKHLIRNTLQSLMSPFAPRKILESVKKICRFQSQFRPKPREENANKFPQKELWYLSFENTFFTGGDLVSGQENTRQGFPLTPLNIWHNCVTIFKLVCGQIMFSLFCSAEPSNIIETSFDTYFWYKPFSVSIYLLYFAVSGKVVTTQRCQ